MTLQILHDQLEHAVTRFHGKTTITAQDLKVLKQAIADLKVLKQAIADLSK